jgi:hypothetical protein
MKTLAPRDEREAGIDLAADRLAFLVVSYGLLTIVAYRGLVLGEASWDLLGLVILGGAVGLAYRLRKRAVSSRWAAVLVGTMVLAAVVAAASVVAQLPR